MELKPYSFITSVTVWAASQEDAETVLPAVVSGIDDFDWTYDDWTSNDPDWIVAMGGVVEE